MGPNRNAAIAAVLVCLLLVGRALAADGNCPNGLPFCFAADTPVLASQVNHDFAQLKEWIEAKVGTVGTGVNITGPATVTGALTAGSVSTGGTVSAASLTTSGAATIGGSASVGGGLSVTGNVTATGNVYGSGSQISCAKGSNGNGFQFCCRMNQRTGATDCRQFTAGGAWTGVASPFGAAAQGLYSLSCASGEPGLTFPFCCRMDMVSGSAACVVSSNWALASWSSWPNPF